MITSIFLILRTGCIDDCLVGALHHGRMSLSRKVVEPYPKGHILINSTKVSSRKRPDQTKVFDRGSSHKFH
jgi:hypothetical protein